MKCLSIVIPVFRNEKSLQGTYETIRSVIKKDLPDYDYEFVFVDDGSDDSSLDELLKLHQQDAKVKVIKFSRNFGQFSAINAGMHYAKGDMVVNISADQQDPPEMIAKMVKEAEKGSDIVIAHRTARNDSRIKNMSSSLYWKLIRLSNPNFPDGGFDFWLFNRKALNAYKQFGDTVRSNQVDVLSVGFKIKFLPYERKKRKHGKSQYNFSKRLQVALHQILSTSYWPLRLASFSGFLFALSGIIYAIRITYNYFFHSVPFLGWAPLMILQLLIGGIIITMLGIIGEYLWRIYFEIKKRPLYFIDEIFDVEKNHTEKVVA